ncbi:Ig domain protein group 2 domain protein [Paenibacillus filicis]|uniref:Ig domain protein group 2 domain protein n=1 Tax=Paenibacillus gyeongsangnamensis TaxID=3388067 RepID=A0ABT4Q9R9_9BACL|nr:Ig domain protein group 2 domain protein [Paenibacillus filicis]MCZ8513626.1 Ig domain protein group 2 domain protein [Paenibacillus filicis]
MKSWKKILLASVMSGALLLQGSLLTMDRAYGEGPADPAPVINPVGTPNGKTILFDNTHEETAGSADWVIDGAFSDFGNALAGQGYLVKELRQSTPITLSDLQQVSVFVMAEPNIPLKTTEQDAILQYVQAGGSILFIGDHYNADRNLNRWDGAEVFNGYRRGAYQNPTKGMSAEEASSAAMQGVTSTDWLMSNFGVRFRYNAIGDVTANNIVAPNQSFNITSGVSTFAMHAGATLAIGDPNQAKGIVYVPSNPPKWTSAVDQGVYNGGGVAEGPMVAIAKKSMGKAAFIGDSSPVEDATPKYKREDTGATKTTYAGWQEQNDATLMVNLVNWLAAQESYTSFSSVPGLQLDQPTALLSMETPANSTEPKAEPWSTPVAGYKWYDPSTFKLGSYGYGSGTTPPPPVGTTILSETFDTGTKGAYAAGNVTLSSGSWYFDNALLGNLSTDAKYGTQSARIKSAGSITMNFNVTGASQVILSVANFGSDTGATWKLQKSTDSGSTWTDVTSAVTATSTLTQQTINVGATGAVRFRVSVAGTASSRLNVDNFQVIN